MLFGSGFVIASTTIAFRKKPASQATMALCAILSAGCMTGKKLEAISIAGRRMYDDVRRGHSLNKEHADLHPKSKTKNPKSKKKTKQTSPPLLLLLLCSQSLFGFIAFSSRSLLITALEAHQ